MFNFFNYTLLSKLTSSLPPELLHHFFLQALKFNLFQKKRFENLQTKVLGKEFDNPVGLAAGFDKNAEVIKGSFNLGFGFVEVGTVTPMPQKGNPKPRVFKIPEFEAIIQRLGFNNDGIEVFLSNLKKFKKIENEILGVNIGKNKNSKDPISDYKFLYKLVQPYTDYVTINISSPNTPGLRDLQKKDKLEKILSTLSKFKKKNTFIKLSPDLSDKELEDICKLSLNSKIVDGLILTNTTISRKNLDSKPVRDFWKISEDGGLSGPPLKELSNKAIRKTYKLTKGKIILIGVGGISSGRDAFEKISSGCSLLQLYTSLVYKGPNVVINILSELSILLKQKGIKKVEDLVGKNINL
ncbi:MAG: dihydroorotate dehydrogenase (quinone) [Rickettsiales bacterium]|nr:dihydroorotate dehydrogenase (quinone) [Rickettsiales bacterium]|tara:strand:+ start:147 stop:1208 length:1062 start_codon:yes stop_codon:yes gene_type:complete